MEFSAEIGEKIEKQFLSLPLEAKTAIISHGLVALISDLNKRLFLAQAKIRLFEEKYYMKLSEMEEKGLPGSCDHEMYEDYIMWHHWSEAAEKAAKQLGVLQPIIEYVEM